MKLPLYIMLFLLIPVAFALESTPLSNNSVEFTWEDYALWDNYDVNKPLRRYLIYRDDSLVGWTNKNTTEFIDYRLIPETTYTYTIAALHDLEGGMWDFESEKFIRGNWRNVQETVNNGTSTTTTLPFDRGLINPHEQFEYKGAFLLPTEDLGVTEFKYGVMGITHYPLGDPDNLDGDTELTGSLYIQGRKQNIEPQGFPVAEISIPQPVISPSKNPNELPRAQFLKPFKDIALYSDPGAIDRGDLVYYAPENKIYYSWIDETVCINDPSLNMVEIDLVNPEGPWNIGSNSTILDSCHQGKFLFAIPEEWSNENTPGKKLITGNHRESGWSGRGPAMQAISLPPPIDEGVEYTTLLQYGDINFSSERSKKVNGYNLNSEWTGGDWVEVGNQSTIILSGTQGVGMYWYGYYDGTIWNVQQNSEDPEHFKNRGQRGSKSHETEGMMLFYNPNDLSRVISNDLETWEVQPYAVLPFAEFAFKQGVDQTDDEETRLGKIAFDEEKSLLYVLEPKATPCENCEKEAVVHVFKINEVDSSLPTNNAPIAEDDLYVTDEDITLNIITENGILANDSDLDNDELSITISNNVNHGTLLMNSDGSFTYTPTLNFYGIDQFTYSVSDGFETDFATVFITVDPVNDVPIANNKTYTINENSTILISELNGVLSNDSDIDGNSLSAILKTIVTHGILTLNDDGSFIYSPSIDFFGLDSFTYAAYDGNEESDIATITIIVNEVIIPPKANNDIYTVNEDEILNVPFSSGLLINDGENLTASIVLQPSFGTLDLNEDGSFIYEPNSNYNGADEFIYRATSNIGSTDDAQVFITINPVDDSPKINVIPNQSINEGDEFTSFDLDDYLTEVDGDNVNWNISFVSTSNIFASINHNNVVTLTPHEDSFGITIIKFTVIDETSQRLRDSIITTFTVNSVNDLPEPQNDFFRTNEDEHIILNVLQNDIDIDDDQLSITSITKPPHGNTTLNLDQTITYTPNNNYNGFDTFNYTITDMKGGFASATVYLTINPVNDIPIIISNPKTSFNTKQEWSYQMEVEDDNEVIYSLEQGPVGMSINQNGLLKWSAEIGAIEQIVVSVYDGEYIVYQSFTLTANENKNMDVKIMHARLSSEEIKAGESVDVSIHMNNKGNVDLNDARVNITVPELGVRRSSKIFDIEKGDKKDGIIKIPIPHFTISGDYLLKITIKNDYYHESVYRYVSVIE